MPVIRSKGINSTNRFRGRSLSALTIEVSGIRVVQSQASKTIVPVRSSIALVHLCCTLG
jgi:hypothetical protein